MPSIDELRPLVAEPREDLAVEYKTWLNIAGDTEHKAVLAKAAIAIANHGGGYIVVGFDDQGDQLVPVDRPETIPALAQDAVNAAIQRYAMPSFHCELYNVPHAASGNVHPVIVVPGNMTEPVMSKRDCQGVLIQNRVYIRKPGPRSQEPQTGDEWRELLRRCVLAGREDMLDAIRSIVSGRLEAPAPAPDAGADLHAFAQAAHARWAELATTLPAESVARFPLGYYEMAFSLVGAEPTGGLAELRRRLELAQRIRLTGWTSFLAMNRPEWAPYPHDNFVEAWVGRPAERNLIEEPAHCDFWRASPDGKLYTIRGYSEDGIAQRVVPGTAIDITLPIWRIGEGLLFASRFAEAFEDVQSIAIECRFTGLEDRHLTSIDRSRAVFDDCACRTDGITLTARVIPAHIQNNLAEVVKNLLGPLYERFDFFQPGFELFETETNRLRHGRF